MQIILLYNNYIVHREQKPHESSKVITCIYNHNTHSVLLIVHKFTASFSMQASYEEGIM